MKREFPPIFLALVLILSCVSIRLLGHQFPAYVPNISPTMAIAFVGAMYLPRRWGWLIGPVALVLADLAFSRINYISDGHMFSWWTLVGFGIYAVAGVLGVLIAQRKSLVKIVSGSLGLSLAFYVVANTFAWASGSAMGTEPGYAMNLAGWWQANTVGLPGWEPTWHFLRNGMAGDLFFVFVLLAILDRGFLLGHAPAKAAARAA
jgi:hypothetical protein